VSAFVDHEEGTLLLVYATPKSSKNATAGLFDGRLKVTIKAPPVEGAANTELLKFLRKELGIGRDEIELVQGQAGRRKTVLIRGLEPTEVRSVLCPPE